MKNQAFSILFLALAVVSGIAADKPVFLYSRHFNAIGDARYQPDGTYSDVLKRLGAEFQVRVNSDPMTDGTLAGVNIILISNPSEKAVGTNPAPHHVTDADIAVLKGFVSRGGGVIVMGNQENHNVETEHMNRLLGEFGLKFINRYTDIKGLPIPATIPTIGGLKWGYYSGNQVGIEKGHPARPRSLVDNDLSVKLFFGNRDEPGSLLAVAEPGRGRVVVITDAGFISNSVLADQGIGGHAIPEQQNWEIFRRLSHWASGK